MSDQIIKFNLNVIYKNAELEKHAVIHVDKRCTVAHVLVAVLEDSEITKNLNLTVSTKIPATNNITPGIYLYIYNMK